MWLALLTALSTALSLLWPLPQPRVERPFEPPPKPWSAGHRGVDLTGRAGQKVAAAGPGTVAFAGEVAGRGVVSLLLDGGADPPLRTTYEPVNPEVSAGDRVVAGQPLGTLRPGPSHCEGRVCLHWGLRQGRRYLDPLAHAASPRPVLLPVPAREAPGAPSAGVRDVPSTTEAAADTQPLAGTPRTDPEASPLAGPALLLAAAAGLACSRPRRPDPRGLCRRRRREGLKPRREGCRPARREAPSRPRPR